VFLSLKLAIMVVVAVTAPFGWVSVLLFESMVIAQLVRA